MLIIAFSILLKTAISFSRKTSTRFLRDWTGQQVFFCSLGNTSKGIINKFRSPTILQLNIEGLTASKMSVLYHLAAQFEALVILLQESHCTSAQRLVLPDYQLARFSLSKKHGLAAFVDERLKWTLFFPISTYIGD